MKPEISFYFIEEIMQQMSKIVVNCLIMKMQQKSCIDYTLIQN